ncbi:MAG: Maf family protein, partial [Alistipes sp.]|nr:Maf family protein [Alistipes sp.]
MLLHDKLKNYRLILASQSPRRRQLLEDADIEFTLAPR